jgi:hypothetical protein
MIRLKRAKVKCSLALSGLLSIVFLQPPTVALALQPKYTEASVSSGCTPYKFIGMRGSGQKYDDPAEKIPENRQMGPEMASLYGYLQNFQEFKGKMSFSGVPNYPAPSVPLGKDWSEFIESLETISTIELIKEFSNEVQRCPDTKFIIAGYSQGAYGAHYLIKIMEENKAYLRNSLVGAIFLANPSENKNGILKYSNLAVLGKGVSASDIKRLYIAKVDEKFLKTLSYFKSGDVVADFPNNLKLGDVSAKNVAKQLYEMYMGKKIHSSYCSPTGKYAPVNKGKRSSCKAELDKDFLQTSAIYIRGQLDELRRLENQKRQNVISWYGTDWIVPTSCGQIMTPNLSKLQKDLASEFGANGAFRFRILALNVKDSSIWFVNEVNSELVSYNADDGFYSLEGFEKMQDIFGTVEGFSEEFVYLSKRGLISNLVLDSEDDWRCEIDLGMND